MILSKIHIINFGKLKDFSYDFNKNMNTFVLENGWGKTTLSNFIMAMLYGFNGNGRSINTNLRKKYLPWNNGVYGGSLEFEHNGKSYLIERTFGSNFKDDTFNLYDLSTNKISNDYTSNIGFEVLGLDYESFERSIYIPQKDLELGFNDDLKSKLANIIGGTNDVQNYESAINIISTKYKEIKKSSKAGKIIDKKLALEEVEKEIKIASNNIATIAILEKDVEELKIKIESLNKDRVSVFNDLKELNEYENYKKALNQLNHLKEELSEIKNELLVKENILNNNSIDNLNYFKTKISEHDALIIERDVLRKKVVQKPVEEVISNNDLSELEMKISNLDKLKNAINKTSIFVGVSLGLMLIGLTILFVLDKFFGGIVIGVSLLSFIIFILILSNCKKKKRILIENVSYILKKNNLDVIDINHSLNYLKVKKNEQVKSLENKVKDNDEINAIEIRISEITSELNSYFSKFNLSSISYSDKVNELETALSEVLRLRNTITTKEAYINQFIVDNKLDLEYNENNNDFNSLKNKSEELNRIITSLEQELNRLTITISNYEEDIIKKEELLAEKDRIINEIANMEKNYNILKTTESLLNKAQDSLLAKYVKPMKDRMSSYLSLISDKNFFIDTDFNFTYEENGIRREIDYYSKGIQQLIVLCMRFSLIDCLFVEDKTFIILDDSFVDFDKDNIDIIKKVINRLTEEYQVIYFTCHESRKI